MHIYCKYKRDDDKMKKNVVAVYEKEYQEVVALEESMKFASMKYYLYLISIYWKVEKSKSQ